MAPSQGVRRRVLRHKAQLCLMGLAEFRDYWPFVDWMYRLFSDLLQRLRGEEDSCEVRQRELQTAQPHSETTRLQDDPMDNNMEATHGDGTAVSLSLFGRNPNSLGDIELDFGAHHRVMAGMLSSENFLDPFFSLDGVDWYDPSTANLTFPGLD